MIDFIKFAPFLVLAAPDAAAAEPPPAAEAGPPAARPRRAAPPEAAAEPVVPGAAPVVSPRATENPLVPPGEAARMSPREVSPGIVFTPGEGIDIQSADHDFSVGIGFRFQLLYTLLHDAPATGETVQSLQVRRARAQLAGHAFGVHNKYRLELAISPTDVSQTLTGVTTSPLLEAYTEFDYLRDCTVRAGQFKVPFDRMRIASDMARQLVDYSGTTAEFSLDRDVGVDLRSDDLFGLGLLRYRLGVFSGKGRNSFAALDLGLLYLARFEVLPFGQFRDYTEGDFERVGPRLSVGGAFARVVDARRDRVTFGNMPLDVGGTTDFDLAEGDLAFKMYGLSLEGAFYYRHGDRNPGSLVDASGKPIRDPSGRAITEPSPTRDGTGLVAQAGFMIPRLPLEFAGRYANSRGSSKPGHDGLRDSNELGGGMSFYFAQHQLKVQADYFRIYESTPSTGYDQVRVQLQLVM